MEVSWHRAHPAKPIARLARHLVDGALTLPANTSARLDNADRSKAHQGHPASVVADLAASPSNGLLPAEGL